MRDPRIRVPGISYRLLPRDKVVFQSLGRAESACGTGREQGLSHALSAKTPGSKERERANWYPSGLCKSHSNLFVSCRSGVDQQSHESGSSCAPMLMVEIMKRRSACDPLFATPMSSGCMGTMRSPLSPLFAVLRGWSSYWVWTRSEPSDFASGDQSRQRRPQVSPMRIPAKNCNEADRAARSFRPGDPGPFRQFFFRAVVASRSRKGRFR